MVLSIARGQEEGMEDTLHNSIASRYQTRPLPKFTVPGEGLSKEAAYQVIHDELQMDGNPKFDLGSFTTTFMEPECDKIILETLNKNYIDMDEYPITTEIQDRCVNMIAHLFHAPLKKGASAVGTGTVGSSEAIMLAGLAFKRKWQARRKAEGKPYDKPNIVTGANVQVCWEKFASYFEVELKDTKLREDFYVMDPHEAIKLVDENTICVAAILGSTYTGEFEDIKLLNDLLLKKNKETGWNTPIHVDAASGGFIAPFVYPDLEWDFRLPLVKSINVSGHKYGLVYPGIGWNIWRSQEDLPEELIFHINYLGTDQPTFTLNFSKGASQVIAQYYQLIRLGFEGYKEIMTNTRNNATALRNELLALDKFTMLSKDVGVPLVSFTLKDKSKCYDEHDIAGHMKRFGWMIPAYTLAPNAQNITIMRIVVREDFSRQYVDRLVRDITRSIEYLEAHPPQLIEMVDASSISKTSPELAKHIASHQQHPAGSQSSNGESDEKKDSDDSKHPAKEGSAFDPELNKQGAFRLVKKHGGVPKTNGPC